MPTITPKIVNLIEKFLEIMFEQKTDFTLTFRKLSESLENQEKKLKFFSLFKNEKHSHNYTLYTIVFTNGAHREPS